MGRVEQPQNAGKEKRLRLFVAVLLPPAWLTALEAVQRDLRAAGLRLRYVRPDGVHLTLTFLGDVPAGRLAEINDALAEAVPRASAFDLALDGLGTFGPARRPRVVWVGVGGDHAQLSTAHQTIDAALSRRGFPPEVRAFNPHLTLARVPEDLSAEDAARIVPALAGITPLSAERHHVASVSLMQSHLGPGGARYDELGSWMLASAEEM
ncbi:MAG: RNA 2',3'-cyclic phosphodiesterase [Dehalococcoidia bacterium]